MDMEVSLYYHIINLNFFKGKEVAIFVKNHFIEELKKNENFSQGKMDIALKETFLKMDRLLQTPEGKIELKRIKNNGNSEDGGDMTESNAGCTANVALLHKKKLYVANAGDSRCILASRKSVIPLSEDHKPDLETEKKRIIKAGGFVIEGRVNSNLNLSRALGDLEYKKNPVLSCEEQLIIALPDIQTYDIDEKTDFILMGCDGIWETLSNIEIVQFIYDQLRNKIDLKVIVETLLDKLIANDTFSKILLLIRLI